MFTGDLAEWVRRYWWSGPGASAAVGFTLDWSMLYRQVQPGSLVRAWSLTFAHLLTIWIAVALEWAGVWLFLTPGWLRSVGALMMFAVPLWCAVAPVAWVFSRWRLLPWITEGATTRAKWMAIASPLMALLIVVALVVLLGVK